MSAAMDTSEVSEEEQFANGPLSLLLRAVNQKWVIRWFFWAKCLCVLSECHSEVCFLSKDHISDVSEPFVHCLTVQKEFSSDHACQILQYWPDYGSIRIWHVSDQFRSFYLLTRYSILTAEHVECPRKYEDGYWNLVLRVFFLKSKCAARDVVHSRPVISAGIDSTWIELSFKKNKNIFRP